MANMLRKKATKWHGCCDHCARGTALHMKPGPRERHQARAIEKRQWAKEWGER
ncbi:hypothetical protein J2S59_000180 [Nocardioides massiliensis]|uniref:Uncharacterized protein n=1 Tax=Nocardioides massiliensis TaxID=1325935 RepID=A0ABT9NIX9_9ACTN|nr:hypothetical protein [Nocardioides massiliensis]